SLDQAPLVLGGLGAELCHVGERAGPFVGGLRERENVLRLMASAAHLQELGLSRSVGESILRGGSSAQQSRGSSAGDEQMRAGHRRDDTATGCGRGKRVPFCSERRVTHAPRGMIIMTRPWISAPTETGAQRRSRTPI